MHAEIISIGSELTTGAKLDTNSQWLSLELSAVGIPVHFHATVADDLEENVAVLRAATERSDIVLITGGLGPTLDDLTRDALARVMGSELVLHEESLDVIKAMFAHRGRPMPERNRVQALFPAGSVPIPNPNGTAPGVYVELDRPGRERCRIAAMPGVPSEMKPMFRDSVLPRLMQTGQSEKVIRHARINCFGVGESAAEELLGDVTARGRDPEVGITVHEATITLRIVAMADSISRCNEKIAATKSIIYERLGPYIFGEEDEELQHVIVGLLTARGETLSTAEIATGGLAAHRMTDVAGHDACFLGGIVLSGSSVRKSLLTREGDPDGESPTISEAAAGQLAAACRERFHSDYALSVTACGPATGTIGSTAVPVVYIALSSAAGITVRELNVVGDRAIIKSRTAKAMLNLLRLHLVKGER